MLTVYDDALAAGWVNWSWDAAVTTNNTRTVYRGTRALVFTVGKAYGGLYLHNDTPVSTTGYTSLTFAAQASSKDQKYAVRLMDAQNNQLGPELMLAAYGGDPVAGAWKVYTILLSALGAAGKSVGGIIIQDETGKSQPGLYVDELGFK